LTKSYDSRVRRLFFLAFPYKSENLETGDDEMDDDALLAELGGEDEDDY